MTPAQMAEQAVRLVAAMLPTIAVLALVAGAIAAAVITYDAVTSARVEEARARFWAARRRRLPTAATVKVASRRVESLER